MVVFSTLWMLILVKRVTKTKPGYQKCRCLEVGWEDLRRRGGVVLVGESCNNEVAVKNDLEVKKPP